ncbi:MAG: DNA helicase RecQ [Ruminococcus sp.]|nr:DNA helicase RecQ [Ruminococcus sp.]
MSETKNKYSVLSEYFGHQSFREGQEQLIDAILSGRDALGIMPTGAGKSMCYQIPALMFDGITVVVSPLISLMKDQVSSLIQSGIRAAYLNTSLTQQQYNAALQNARQGMYKLIYVAPERLCTPSFLSLAGYVRISMLAVDEAHCVSQWGQDFRPSYLKIPEFLNHLSYRPVVSAFTATATDAVREDIIKRLTLRAPKCVTTGFDRKNLYFGVVHARDKYSETKEIVLENRDKSGIIYCSTRKNVEAVCEKLNADGIPCTRYHAGLSDKERRQNQDDFIYEKVPVIAATNAFGMGIDKSNVAYVVHYNMPKNLENYYQEAGRAGRDGNEAKCVLLYSGQDVVTNRFLIENSNDNPELGEEELNAHRRREMQKLDKMNAYCNTSLCLRQFILDYFGETKPCTCGNCSNCSGETELKDVTLEAQKILSCVYRLHQRNLHFGASVISQVLRGANTESVKKFGLSTLSTFGIMAGSTETFIRSVIRFLAADGYLAAAEHSTLTLTRAAADVLRGEKKLSMRTPAVRKRSRREELSAAFSKGRKGQRDKLSLIDTDLFGRLRELRKTLAEKEGVPPYIVFSDTALRDMCVKLPRTQSEFLEVSGVGKVKQEKYGSDFTSEIIRYMNEGHTYNDSGDAAEEDLFGYIAVHTDELSDSDEELTLGQLCDGFLSQLGIDADKNELKDAVQSWLINENYLTEKKEDGKTRLAPTILTEETGIVELEKLSSGGRTYKALVFPRAAQQFMIENMKEIAEKAKNNKNSP